MVEPTDNAVAIVRRYVEALEREGIHLEKALLFGSYARGDARDTSDIDVALVSNDFAGRRYSDREKLYSPTFAVDWRIDPLPYRPEDFDESDLLVKEILATGIEIPCGE